MSHSPGPDVTETELAMLQVLWDRGEATRRQVTDALYPGGGDSHYATVQKLLERLEKKDFVRHDRRDGVLVFQPCVDRDEFIRRRLQGLADSLCGGVVAPLVMNLVRSQPLSTAEIDELYAFLDQQRRERERSGTKRSGSSKSNRSKSR